MSNKLARYLILLLSVCLVLSGSTALMEAEEPEPTVEAVETVGTPKVLISTVRSDRHQTVFALTFP